MAARRRAARRRRRLRIRSAQPGDAVPLRSVEEQAFLRRGARVDRFQRQQLTRDGRACKIGAFPARENPMTRRIPALALSAALAAAAAWPLALPVQAAEQDRLIARKDIFGNPTR